MIDSTQLLGLLMSKRGSQGWAGSALWPGNETSTYKLSLFQHKYWCGSWPHLLPFSCFETESGDIWSLGNSKMSTI